MRTQSSSIRSYWQSQWGTVPPVSYENEQFTPPDQQPWIRFRIRNAGGDQVTLGQPSLDRQSGIVHIAVFVPLNEGDARGLYLADRAAGIMRKVNVSGVTFRVPYINVLGNNDEGWWMAAVTCPYYYEELT